MIKRIFTAILILAAAGIIFILASVELTVTAESNTQEKPAIHLGR